MSTLATLVVKLVGDTGDFTDKMGGAERTTSGFLGSMGKNM